MAKLKAGSVLEHMPIALAVLRCTEDGYRVEFMSRALSEEYGLERQPLEGY